MLKELWIDFGVNKYNQYILAHGIAKDLGKKKAEALPFFMPSQDAIPFRFLMEWEKESFGNF